MNSPRDTTRHLRIASEPDPKPDSDVGSNERTNERTLRSGVVTVSNQDTAVDAHPRTNDLDGVVAVGQVIQAGELWRTTTRHPRSRIGERAEIPKHVRAAVWYRDRGKCDECNPEHPSGDVLHLDHIKPWSAGGPDTTDNLRLLCERHNLERSNYVDYARPKRPATWWCANCYALDVHVWDYLGAGYVECPTHGWNPTHTKVRCRVARRFAAAYLAGEPEPTWHQRPLLTSFDQIAYCAHCDAPGMTGVVL